MKYNKNTILIAAAAVLVIVAAVWIYKRRKKGASIIPFYSRPAAGSIDEDKVLNEGSRGPEVSALQEMLVNAGQNIGTTGPAGDGVDGIFGPLTKSALQAITGLDAITLKQYREMTTVGPPAPVAGEIIGAVAQADPGAFTMSAPSLQN